MERLMEITETAIRDMALQLGGVGKLIDVYA